MLAGNKPIDALTFYMDEWRKEYLVIYQFYPSSSTYLGLHYLW